MAEGKNKYISDAAKVIEGRVAALEAELLRNERLLSDKSRAADRAAIAEAKFCAKLIRSLALRPYRGDPYKEARERWLRGETNNIGASNG